MARDKFVKVRVDEAERIQLQRVAEAEGFKTLSDYFRWQAFAEKVTDASAIRASLMKEKNRHLSAIGNNLNQIARAINEAKISGEPIPASLENLVEQTQRWLK